MAFNFSRGRQIIGDLSGSDDPHRNTGIDFEDDEINLVTSGSVRMQINNDGVFIPDLDPSTAGPVALRISGGVEISPGHNAGLTFRKGNNELNFIAFANEGDTISSNARMSYQVAEHLFIYAGRQADFYVQTAQASGNSTYPFRIMDDGTARFEKGLEDGTVSAADLADDIAFYVSGTVDGNNNALFMGNVKLSGALLAKDNVIVDGRVGIGTDNPSYKLEVGGNMAVGQYIYHRNDANTFINFTDNRVRINAGGNNFIDCEDPGSAPHKVRINNGGNNIDFIIKDNSNKVYFTADASTRKVGIGHSGESAEQHTPIAELDVSGAIAITKAISTPSQPAVDQGYLYTKTDGKLYWRSSALAETDLTSGGGGGGSDVPENVITGSTSLALASSNNRDTIIITPLSGDVTYTLPDPEANFKIKFLAGSNLDSHNIIFKTKQSSQKIFGMFYRISQGGDSDTGYDVSPLSYNGAANSNFAGGASEVHKNTVTVDNALQGTEIDFYSDGVYWYVKGEVVATIAGISLSATITFTSGSY